MLLPQEGPRTLGAPVGLLSRVSHHMHLQISLPHERLTTFGACDRLLSGHVGRLDVCPEVALPFEDLLTLSTGEGLFLAVGLHVAAQKVLLGEGYSANVTSEWLLHQVCLAVSYQVLPLLETFAAHRAQERPQRHFVRGCFKGSSEATSTHVHILFRKGSEGTGFSAQKFLRTRDFALSDENPRAIKILPWDAILVDTIAVVVLCLLLRLHLHLQERVHEVAPFVCTRLNVVQFLSILLRRHNERHFGVCQA